MWRSPSRIDRTCSPSPRACGASSSKAYLTFTTPPQPATDVIVDTVPLLRTLRLSDAAFLACLSHPLLQDVVVGASDETADALLPLLAFLRRKTPPLTSVCLHSGTLVPKTLAAILAEKPAIHTLRIRIRRVDTAAIDALVAQLEVTPNNVVLAPNLATLMLARCASFDQDRFIHMLRSRLDFSITHVVLRMLKRALVAESTLTRLDMLRKEGVRC
ncbi:hypothetical protein C8J57DRAFT_1343543 [Mycena rebaudengoi]|nr:hypothetical protein C8J57DRAFT_1343543 [Mycena rebaudengoi]